MSTQHYFINIYIPVHKTFHKCFPNVWEQNNNTKHKFSPKNINYIYFYQKITSTYESIFTKTHKNNNFVPFAEELSSDPPHNHNTVKWPISGKFK